MNRTRKIVLAAMLVALAIVGSLISVPVFGSRAAPIQHLVNVISALILGPAYSVIIAFLASLLRNMLGWGTPLAFPGSMFGALLAGLFYRYGKKVWAAFLGEVVGTAILGGVSAAFLAKYLLGAVDAAATLYIFPFFLSSISGSLLAVIVYRQLVRTGVLKKFLRDRGS